MQAGPGTGNNFIISDGLIFKNLLLIIKIGSNFGAKYTISYIQPCHDMQAISLLETFSPRFHPYNSSNQGVHTGLNVGQRLRAYVVRMVSYSTTKVDNFLSPRVYKV